MVVSCMASWCGPCKSMDIYFEELARQFQDILFVKVDAGVLKVILILSTKVMHKDVHEGRIESKEMAHL